MTDHETSDAHEAVIRRCSQISPAGRARRYRQAPGCALHGHHGGWAALSGPAMSGGDRCYQHSEDPMIAEHRAVSRRLGGINETHDQRFLGAEAAPPVLEHPEGVRALLADTIQQVRTGQLPPAAQTRWSMRWAPR